MRKKLGFFVLLLTVTFLFTACEGTDQEQTGPSMPEKNRDKASGLELIMDLDKTEYELDEEVAVRIKLINHDEVEKIVGILEETPDGIASVRTYHLSEHWQGIFHPKSLIDRHEPKKGELGNVLFYTIGPNETLEQEFMWNQLVMDQIDMFSENNELNAPTGEYKVMAFLLIGDKDLLEQPPEELAVNVNITIKGDRELVSLAEAKEIALANREASQWFHSRTYDQLIKKKRGKWLLNDEGGNWIEIDKNLAEQMKEVEPGFSAERQGDHLILKFSSRLGGSPHRMVITINTQNKRVTSVDFED